MRIQCDTLVLGSGIAGLTLALEAARHGDVLVVTKRSTEDSASAWAQGGIASVLDPRDSFEAHAADTLATGAGLADPDIVNLVVREGPARIEALARIGARFTRVPGSETLDLTREGGHSARRVVHAGDMTGREVQRALNAAVAETPRIRILEDHMAVDLIEGSRFDGETRVLGAYLLDERTGGVMTCLARNTVLATGGAGKVYQYTSNPDVATGDGVAMAYRAGAEIANMEFFQFHPTCLYHPQARTFLISEALRGEGGVLRLADGTAFMAEHHPNADLAPRDVTARAIDYEMKRSGASCVFLDMTALDSAWLAERFENIHAECLRWGIDLTKSWIPVVPAAHYMCGGVVTDDEGRTSLPGLLAIGEVASTGLHGANRLASNSLLEGLVFGHRAARALAATPPIEPSAAARIPDWDSSGAIPPDEAIVVSHTWGEIRRLMWNYVGIVRSDRRLRRAERRIRLIQEEIRDYYWQYLVNRDLIELRNLADVAELIIRSASARRESRGLHFTLDHPAVDPALDATDTVIRRGDGDELRARKGAWMASPPPPLTVP
jgi:L-aspartate oxidase